MKEFDYLAPKDLGEALRVTQEAAQNHKLLAGGTSLIPQMVRGDTAPGVVIDINGVRDLNYIKTENGIGKIGALTTISDLVESPSVKKYIPILWEAARKFGGPQIRNRATVGGNLINASPAADMAVPLLALKANLRLISLQGDRTLPLKQFFTGYRQTDIKPDEILTEVSFPIPRAGTKQAYYKLGLWKAMAISVTSVGVALLMDGDICVDAGISLGAVAPTPLNAEEAETVLKGRKVNRELAEKCGIVAAVRASPIKDIRASSEYRRAMCQQLTRLLICQSLGLESQV